MRSTGGGFLRITRSQLGTAGRVLGAVGLGLSPYLGQVVEPLEGLLNLFPTLPFDTRTLGIPLFAFVMGVVAFVAPKLESNPQDLKRGLYVAAGCLVAFVVVNISTVVHRPVAGGEETVSVLVGFTRPDSCIDCKPEMPDAKCLEYTTLNPSRIWSCWSTFQINASLTLLILAYLGLTASTGFVIGVAGRGSHP